jgi:FAD/FMN-containing dehydrogenase
MKIISSLKYYTDSLFSNNKEMVDSFPGFNFLIDRIPEWPQIFKKGFYEIEPLIPRKNAPMAINEMLKLFHKYNMPPYLAGIKLHKKDDFLLSYSLDGFSIGFDFPVLPNRLQKQKQMFYDLHKIVVDNNGLIYLAKDNLVTTKHFKMMYSSKIEKFFTIKKRYDPNELFQSNLFRRLFFD